jgi:hypothetical protein
VNQSFDFLAWHESIKEFAWWNDDSMAHSWHLLEVTKRAHEAKRRYWLQSPIGCEPLDLTDLYEQITMLVALKKDYNE